MKFIQIIVGLLILTIALCSDPEYTQGIKYCEDGEYTKAFPIILHEAKKGVNKAA